MSQDLGLKGRLGCDKESCAGFNHLSTTKIHAPDAKEKKKSYGEKATCRNFRFDPSAAGNSSSPICRN